jgi:hypothetical protein
MESDLKLQILDLLMSCILINTEAQNAKVNSIHLELYFKGYSFWKFNLSNLNDKL